MTLTGGMHMKLGGAPAGPAGTGKTETTKDLAKALAKQCVVFNCSDGLDYLAMGKFFKGLASSGAWACFDEFNRINIEVLSVIAGQILTLQNAVQNGWPRTFFEDREIVVNPEFAPFITMNPGYAGRSALPDNLQSLFRPVAMMVPDYALIGEIMLFSFGFLDGKKCAKKMVATFKLCSEQLSSQPHYDYGMRAVKTVIMAAGNLKMADPDMLETKLIMRALQDVNIPKFLAHDLPLFAGIMSDLFPGVSRPDIDYGPLFRALKLGCEKANLQAMPWFLTKSIELYEMICVRHGLMVVGPTGGGKSSNIKLLQGALTYLADHNIEGIRYVRQLVYHLNPKSITMGQLYGQFDPNTHEWQDGILAGMIRKCARSTTPDGKWVLFDGPVDAIWIENMNTVLDDNKKLCLTSGEIMALSEEMTMMFEPEDLEVASPATVSRCGMIYMEPHSLGYECIIASWLQILPKALPKTLKNKFRTFCDRYLSVCLQLLSRHLSEPLGTADNTLVCNFLKLLDCYYDPFREKEGCDPPSAQEVEDMDECTESLCMFTFIWSVLCTVNFKGRQVFDSFIRSEMASYQCQTAIPEEGLIYDYKFCTEEKCWKPWMTTVPEYTYNAKAAFSELIIPTLDSVRYSYFFHLLVSNKKHVLFVGNTGTGKTINVMNQLSHAFGDKMVPLCLAFSARTSANLTQDTIDSKCEKRRKGVYGPAAGKQFCIFVDDMNMPMKEEYGAQPPIEILRQWFDNSGWFDRKLLEFRKIIDCIMVCACGPPGGGRNEVTARFTRHFNTITYADLETTTMELIFETILANFLKFGGYAEEVKGMAHQMVHSVVEVFNNVLDTLRPTPAKCHYSFNLRDISKVFQGMLMMTKTKVNDRLSMARMFCHENTRQFADRFINTTDKDWFQDQLKMVLHKHMKMEYEEVMSEKRLICADFMVPGADPRIYEEVEYDKLQSTCEEYLSEYNHDSKQPMGLVMFLDAIQHVARISRTLRQPKGNMLLLGVGGSGRQSLTRLATFMAEYKIFQVEIAKGYGVADWKENLRECLMHAGIENKPIVFLFNDSQVVFESMLEDLNGVLNGGDVPNLYAMEDLETIMTTCKPDCVKKRIPPTKLNIYNAYISRVMNNIHMCMCMSPIGDAFRTRLRMFPSFVNCSTIDWFTEWPEEALQHVAISALTEHDMQLGNSLQDCVNFVKNCQMSVSKASLDFLAKASRHNYVTPTSYLEVIATYKDLLDKKRKVVGTMKNRLKVGLDKLISTADQVAVLQVQLVEMQPVLAKTQVEVDAMIIQIGIDKESANETKIAVSKEEEGASVKAAATTAIAEDAQRDLDEALPALEMAVACLNKLKKSDLDEVKSLGKPPAGVKLTMEACCIMFQVKPNRINDPDNVGKKLDDYWSAAKGSVLANANKLLADLMSFDKDHIPQKVIEKIDHYMENPGFTPKEIEKASKACTAICMWVRAMHKYHNVALMVEPKKKLLAEAQVC
jgi:dynein heavy chain